MKRTIVAIFLFLIFAKGVYGQESCSQVLIKAQISYYEGRANEVPQILTACLKDGFTTDEKLQAYRLLTITYLYLNEPANAENSLLLLLRLNPEYRVNEALDPTEFINLFHRFRTQPVYLIGVKGGANLAYGQAFKHYSLDNTLTTKFSYQPLVSYQAGAFVELPLKQKGLSFTAGLYVTGKKFLYKSSQFTYMQVLLRERQHHVSIPVGLIYHLYRMQQKRWQPFITAGLSMDVLLSATSQVSREDNNRSEELKREVTGPNVTLFAQRRKLTYSAMIGGGLKLKSGRNLFILEASYRQGIANVVKPRQRYSNTDDLIFKYGYLDNNFRLSTAWLSVGYIIPVYRPKIISKQ